MLSFRADMVFTSGSLKYETANGEQEMDLPGIRDLRLARRLSSLVLDHHNGVSVTMLV